MISFNRGSWTALILLAVVSTFIGGYAGHEIQPWKWLGLIAGLVLAAIKTPIMRRLREPTRLFANTASVVLHLVARTFPIRNVLRPS
jgi:hypothetical protein